MDSHEARWLYLNAVESSNLDTMRDAGVALAAAGFHAYADDLQCLVLNWSES